MHTMLNTLRRAVPALVAAAALAALALPATAGAATSEHGDAHAVQPGEPGDTLDLRALEPSAGEFERLAAVAARRGVAQVSVGLHATFKPEGTLAESEVRARRGRFREQRTRVLDALRGTEHRVLHRYSTLPYVALELSGEALEALPPLGGGGDAA